MEFQLFPLKRNSLGFQRQYCDIFGTPLAGFFWLVPTTEVTKMWNKQSWGQSHFSLAQRGQLFWRAVFAGSLLVAVPATASNEHDRLASINKIAVNAYCAEVQSKSSSLANGSISYKHVLDLASERAFSEHPNVYRSPFAWKARLTVLLDQYGDDPASQLCSDNPDPGRDLDLFGRS